MSVRVVRGTGYWAVRSARRQQRARRAAQALPAAAAADAHPGPARRPAAGGLARALHRYRVMSCLMCYLD